MDDNTENTLHTQFLAPNYPTVREIVDVCKAFAESEGFQWPEWPEDAWLAIAPEDGEWWFQPFDLNLWTDDGNGEAFITYYVEKVTSFGVSISVADYLGKEAYAETHKNQAE